MIEDWTIGRGTFGNYEEIDTNAFFAQMWVQLDFDIIDLTFTKNNVETVIPVVLSPMDIAADADHPVVTTGDGEEDPFRKWIKIILFIIFVIIIVILLIQTGLLPLLVKAVVWVVLLPFRLIAYIVNLIKQSGKSDKK